MFDSGVRLELGGRFRGVGVDSVRALQAGVASLFLLFHSLSTRERARRRSSSLHGSTPFNGRPHASFAGGAPWSRVATGGAWGGPAWHAHPDAITKSCTKFCGRP